MELTEDEYGLRYPHLFREAIWPWGPARVRFELFERIPDPETVANTNMVGWVGRRCLVLRLEDGSPEIPGGTLEPGDDYLQALRRELREEAGARLATHQILGGWLCRSLAPVPFRPHLPHPDYIRLVVCGDVEISGPPEHPPGGERVEQVELVSPDRAAEIFQAAGRSELAELYLLAAELRKSR